MSAESNTAVVRRFEEAFAANDVAAIDALCAPDLVDHNPAPGQSPDLAGFKRTIARYTSTFPDLHSDLAAVIGEGDLVATRWTVTGTHRAEFFGIPATGKRVAGEGMNFYRPAGGKITEVWTQFDALGLLQQLGAIPEPG
jgi:steroid delta-isomerase-like uncharacterized protein